MVGALGGTWLLQRTLPKWHNTPLGAAAGALCGALTLAVLGGWSLMPLGLLCGAALGVCCVLTLWAAERAPVSVAAGLVVLALALTGMGQLAQAPQMGALATLGALPLLLALARRPEARAGLPLNLPTAVVLVYALFQLPSLVLLPLATALTLTAPLALYAVGAMLAALPAPDRLAAPPLDLARRGRRWGSRILLWAPLAVGGVLALIAIGQTLTGGALPARSLLPDARALAVVLGMTLVLALSWDSTHLVWRTVLGPLPRWLRVALAVAVALGLVLLMAALALTWSRTAIFGALAALGGSALLRRRWRTLVPLLLGGPPLLALVGRGHTGWLSDPLGHASTLLGPQVWRDVATQALTGLPGVGGGISAYSQYAVTLRETGTPGLLALVAVLAVALTQSFATYRLLRPASVEAGSVLAAGALAAYALVAGLASTPLREPVVALSFWLLLGYANGLSAALAPTAPEPLRLLHTQALRGFPLRVVYVVDETVPREALLSLLDLFRALDRQRVTPLLLAQGACPIIEAARLAQVTTVQVPQVSDATASLFSGGLPTRLREARWLLHAWLAGGTVALGGEVRHLWSGLREWAGLVRAILTLHPDLLVSNGARLHLRTLAAGRLCGVPVQWHVRDAASPAAQQLLDVFALWTAGVVATSQTLAQAFALRTLGSVVRVVRPGVALPPAGGEHTAQVRQALGLAATDLLLVCPGPIRPGSGHLELLAALPEVVARLPHLHLLLVEEALPDASLPGEDPRAERVRRVVARAGLEQMVHVLGARADFGAVLAAADVAVFPQRRETDPRALLQALARGVPIVATEAGVLREHLAEAWGHLLVPPGDGPALVAALEHMLTHLGAFREDARRNPWLVRDWSSATAEAGRLLTLYRRACLPRPAAPFWLRGRSVPFPRAWLAALRSASV